MYAQLRTKKIATFNRLNRWSKRGTKRLESLVFDICELEYSRLNQDPIINDDYNYDKKYTDKR